MFKRFFNRSAYSIAAIAILPSLSIACKQKNKRQIYVWGNGIYQARPDALLQFQNFTPKKIENLPQNLAKLIFGEYYEGGIDTNGNLYIWDKHFLDANYDQKDKDCHQRKNIKLIQKNVKIVKFTNGYIWILSKDNRVYQYPIIKKFDEHNQVTSTQLGSRRQVTPLKGTVQLQTGRDHVIALNQKGEVFAMGDDTLGQCGQCGTDRNTYPPFVQRRISYPTKVPNLAQIVQISTGSDHTIALDKLGNLYGWGSNSNMQLSHQAQFSRMSSPLICSYSPLRINKNLDHSLIKQIKTGDQFTILVSENKQNGSNEVYSFGSNLRGQLGANQIRHLKDVGKIEKLSNYILNIDGKQKKVEVEQLQCGKNHCIALLNIGYVMQWGDNEHGQMANKKRSSCLSPIVMKSFAEKKIVGVFASQNNSGVIIQTES